MLPSTKALLTRRAKEWLANSVLTPHIDAYAQSFADRGYLLSGVRHYLNCVAHFSHWCDRQDIDLSEIDQKCVRRFLDRHLRRCRCATHCMRQHHIVRSALNHLLSYLHARGYVPSPASAVLPHIANELRDFDDYLCNVRGLAQLTRYVYLRRVRSFLTTAFPKKEIRMEALSAAGVARYIERHTLGWKPVSTKLTNTALSAYFAYKAMRGEQTSHLVAALPHQAIWRQSQLPKMLSRQEISRLLGAYDRTTATGKRDYAIARCLVDLGLRRVEVARLKLDDVDWREGVLRIAGKGRRTDVLPLPDRTGGAIADYLRSGRPLTTRRELFVRHRPPRNGSADIDLVRNAVRCAAVRCGLQNRIGGTHIFRHTVAGRLMQRGAPLKQIADLLRHRDLDTTTIYAKVDLPALGRVGLPWPGSRV